MTSYIQPAAPMERSTLNASLEAPGKTKKLANATITNRPTASSTVRPRAGPTMNVGEHRQCDECGRDLDLREIALTGAEHGKQPESGSRDNHGTRPRRRKTTRKEVHHQQRAHGDETHEQRAESTRGVVRVNPLEANARETNRYERTRDAGDRDTQSGLRSLLGLEFERRESAPSW